MFAAIANSVNKLSADTIYYIVLGSLFAYLMETVVLTAIVQAWQIQLFGSLYAMFGFLCLYLKQVWLLKALWVVTLVFVVGCNAAAIFTLVLIYTSEWALGAIANTGKKPDLGALPLIVSMLLLANDIFTAAFLFVLRKHIKNVKKREGKLSSPTGSDEPNPRTVSGVQV